MSKYKILWVDDDINNPELRPDRESLSRENCEIIDFDNPDSFLDYIDDCTIDKPDCIIIDLSMPVGRKITNNKEANHGTNTGLILLKEIQKAKLNNPLIIVYSITDNDRVKEYCSINQIPYWNKMDYLSDEFAQDVVNLIREKRIVN